MQPTPHPLTDLLFDRLQVFLTDSADSPEANGQLDGLLDLLGDALRRHSWNPSLREDAARSALRSFLRRVRRGEYDGRDPRGLAGTLLGIAAAKARRDVRNAQREREMVSAAVHSKKIRIGIVGVGNCASSFVQGLSFYRRAQTNEPAPGLMNVDVGGYHVSDVEISAAFDISAHKVGRDVSEAIFAQPNNTFRFASVPPSGVFVCRGPTLDGIG